MEDDLAPILTDWGLLVRKSVAEVGADSKSSKFSDKHGWYNGVVGTDFLCLISCRHLLR